MKVIIIFLLSLWISAYTQAQLQGIRYRDDIFTGSDTMTEAYGSNVNYLQQNGYLLADYYFPRGDSFQNRAAIIFMHGGGFRAGHRNDAAIMDLCNKLAKKGYLTLSVDYRVGMPTDSDADLSAAIIRAVQDLNAAVRFTKVNAAKLGIDTNLIFISGASAGGIAVLLKAYMKIDTTAAKLGVYQQADLEGATNFLSNTSSVAGVYALWGAVFDTAWIIKGDIPVGCVHSQADSTIPFISGYNKRNGSLTLYGSYAINQRANNQGITTSLHVYNSGRHDLGLKVAPYKDTTVQLMSDFFWSIISSQPEKQESFNGEQYYYKLNSEQHAERSVARNPAACISAGSKKISAFLR